MMKLLSDTQVKYGRMLDDPTLTNAQQQEILAAAEAKRIAILNMIPFIKMLRLH